ncbi:MAG: hypothetical protein FWG70_09060 [Oscillospiraceae bacterium]|nr:hypothetical protein [Oscillospiraceae bacterium]
MSDAVKTPQDFLEEVIGGDPDHTGEARRFYAKYWADVLGSAKEDYNGEDGNYRGDTIISFRTMAGCLIRLTDFKGDIPTSQKGRLDIIENQADVPDKLKVKFKEFYEKYHSLANFMPLPANPNSINLNLMKNRSYNDFPDSFFKDVREYFISNFEKGPDEFLVEDNKDYFVKFGTGEGGWKNYVEKNYLQTFFEYGKDDGYEKFKELAPTDKDKNMPYKGYKKWENDEWIPLKGKKLLESVEIEVCKNEILEFLKNACEIIVERAKTLSEV